MKRYRLFFLAAVLGLLLSSCSLFRAKYGCPSNGKNVGAEKLLDGSKQKKARKMKV